MTRIRFTKTKINWNSFLNYVFLIILSSSLLLIFLIALPLTERLTSAVAFDLNVKEDFWSKEYVLKLDSDNQSDIRKTKNIIFNRLNRYGVEEASIFQEDTQLRVVVETTQPQIYVDELIKSPYQYSIVTRKEEVDFESQENPLAPYLAENYNETEFDASIFRNIYITELPNSSGDKSYFGLTKIWPNRSKEFKDFIGQYQDDYVGIKVDDFVTPIYINDPNLLSIPIGAQDDGIEAIDILYNSGNIPISYTLSEENELEVNRIDINYIEVTIALFVSIIAIYLYTYFTGLYDRKLVLRNMFVVLLSLAIFLAFLKISFIPIHTFILLIDAVVLIMLTNLIKQNPESRFTLFIGSLIIGFVFKIVGIGYLKYLGNHLVIISAITYFSVILGNYYLNKISAYFKK